MLHKTMPHRFSEPNNFGHWELLFTKKRDLYLPDEFFGFVYVIRELSGEFYIGKKQFHRYHKGKTRPHSESSWRSYKGSSKLLNPQKGDFRAILSCHQSRGGLAYAESKLQFLTDCMMRPGEFLNRYIAEIKFKVAPLTPLEIKHSTRRTKHPLGFWPTP